jgi:excisionase family DNA binding protein
MQKLLSTKEVAEFLNVNEKMVYTLVSEKGLPGTWWNSGLRPIP